MKTRAAVMWESGSAWSVDDIELNDPQDDEVVIRMEYAGLCHTDDHAAAGEVADPTPYVGGHEGAGTVVGVGSAVRQFQGGERVVLVPTPACGRCHHCASGRQFLCTRRLRQATRRDGTQPFSAADGRGIGAYAQLGTFSEHTVVNQDNVYLYPAAVPARVAAVMSCAVMTGYGSAVNVAVVRPGDAVVVIGAGGVGSSAVQGARIAGAATVVAVDGAPVKRDHAKTVGATHACGTIDDVRDLIAEITEGRMADSVIICVGLLGEDLVGQALDVLAPHGTLVIASLADHRQRALKLDVNAFIRSTKIIRGSMLGNCNPAVDILRVSALYQSGSLLLDQMVDATYPINGISQGYRDMRAGKNVRGVIDFGDSAPVHG